MSNLWLEEAAVDCWDGIESTSVKLAEVFPWSESGSSIAFKLGCEGFRDVGRTAWGE